jgi:nitroreductase
MKKILLSLCCLGLMLTTTTSCQPSAAGTPQDAAKSTSDIVSENIMSRHSVRAYKPQPVEKATVEAIVKAGINAPSAQNKQPWEVRVISNPDLLARIKAHSATFYDAPTLMIVACDTLNEYGEFDAGLFSQTVMLSAESFDVGTVALGMLMRALNDGTPEANALLQELNFSPNYRVIIGIAMGYKDEATSAKPRDAAKVTYIE